MQRFSTYLAGSAGQAVKQAASLETMETARLKGGVKRQGMIRLAIEIGQASLLGTPFFPPKYLHIKWQKREGDDEKTSEAFLERKYH